MSIDQPSPPRGKESWRTPPADGGGCWTIVILGVMAGCVMPLVSHFSKIWSQVAGGVFCAVAAWIFWRKQRRVTAGLLVAAALGFWLWAVVLANTSANG